MSRTALLLAAALVAACSSAPPRPSPEVVSQLAPTGKLRAAINFGNPVLASRDPASGEPRGVSVDLSRELAARLGVPLEIVPYAAAGRVVEAVKTGAWDVAYVARDPLRSADMYQSPPYVMIEGSYLVPAESTIRSNAEVDRDGIRIAVGKGSAYDLFLTREIRRAMLVRAPTSPEVVSTMIRQNLEVAAGVRQQLEADARRTAGVRLLPGRFMVINQAMAVPKGRDAGAAYVHDFIEEMKASGFVAQSLLRNKVEGAAVAGPDDPKER
ncbi:MAG TPA: ABC transporter substrate-binding protein [Burkholderiales bacterium]|nr:ABC transporter substrate-binding protein [Burkholderiales bacterium]